MNAPPPAILHSIPDAARMLGIGRTSLYAMIADGKLAAAKIAGRTLVPRSEIDRAVAEALAEAAAKREAAAGRREAYAAKAAAQRRRRG